MQTSESSYGWCGEWGSAKNDVAYAEAEEHLAALVVKGGGEPEKAPRLLRSLAAHGTLMTRDIYAEFEAEARNRLASRDPDDRPILDAAFGSWLSDLDGRYRLLWLRRRHVYIREHRLFPHAVAT